MQNRLLLYDVDEAHEALFAQRQGEDRVFSANPLVKHCIGCFGCWVKTPGRCVIQDRCAVMPGYLAQCRRLVIVSPLWYGGYSQSIKAVLDRSIGYLLPYFRLVGGAMHHQMRCDNPFALDVHFYGGADEGEIQLARRLVAGNAVNFGAGSCTVQFHPTADAACEAVL